MGAHDSAQECDFLEDAYLLPQKYELFSRGITRGKFCIAAFIFLSPRLPDSRRNLKRCIRALVFLLERERVLEDRRLKTLHIQEQIPIIDQGRARLSLLSFRSYSGVNAFFLPQQNKHKTNSHSKLLAVRTAAASESKSDVRMF